MKVNTKCPTTKALPRVTSFAPQFLVDDLVRSMSYYQKLGFTFGEPWDGFYVIGELDGLELHLKEAPKHAAERQHRRDHEHLDAAAGVDGIEAFYDRCLANGAKILRPLTATAWGTKDFSIEDPDYGQTEFFVTDDDGYSHCFGVATNKVAPTIGNVRTPANRRKQRSHVTLND